jgi:hypothetical protein
VCYYLRIASSLTLSEVRSMLPPGITADPLSSLELASYRTLLTGAQTAAHLRVGACSCDLVRQRLPDAREDERHLRARYKALGLPRDRIVRELERHRRSTPGIAEPAGGWRRALVAFVAEHARNAGPTVYHLSFHPIQSLETSGRSSPRVRNGEGDYRLLARTLAEVRSNPEGWLEEGSAILVSR